MKIFHFIIVPILIIFFLENSYAYDIQHRFYRGYFKWESHDYNHGSQYYHQIWSEAFHGWINSTHKINGFHLHSGKENVNSVSLNYGATGWRGNARYERSPNNNCNPRYMAGKARLRMNRYYTDNLTRGLQVTIAYHEFGHAFALDHVNDRNDIMFGGGVWHVSKVPNSLERIHPS